MTVSLSPSRSKSSSMSIRVTLDTYSHVVDGLQESAAQKFDDFIGAKNQSVSNPLAKPQNLKSG